MTDASVAPAPLWTFALPALMLPPPPPLSSIELPLASPTHSKQKREVPSNDGGPNNIPDNISSSELETEEEPSEKDFLVGGERGTMRAPGPAALIARDVPNFETRPKRRSGINAIDS
jgi:hypothetical protein